MNPRWEGAEARRRSARMWKVIVGIVTTAAATTVIVASCHDLRERARREAAEPAHVETTGASVESVTAGAEAAPEPIAPPVTAPAATTVTAPAPAPPRATASTPPPPSTNDSAGGIVGVPGSVVTAPRVQAPPAYPQGSSPRPGPFGAAANEANAANADASSAIPTATSDASSTNEPLDGSPPDASSRATSPEGAAPAPAPTAGAGRFTTEAPFWGSSAFPSNPEAGAGPFESDRAAPQAPPR